MIDVSDKIIVATIKPIVVCITAVVVTKFLIRTALKTFIANDTGMSKR
jgi:hypothetical protein